MIYVLIFRSANRPRTSTANDKSYTSNKCKSGVKRGILDTTLCDKVCQLLSTGQWFSPFTLVSMVTPHVNSSCCKI